LDLALDAKGDLIVAVRPGPKGTARPLEVLSLLLNQPLTNLRNVRITKLKMEMEHPPELSQEAQRERAVTFNRLNSL
jgi:hypothetical protein